ncbi:mCG147341 [Mus musculus]|nr:mCG147341 [Mus musculus]
MLFKQPLQHTEEQNKTNCPTPNVISAEKPGLRVTAAYGLSPASWSYIKLECSLMSITLYL